MTNDDASTSGMQDEYENHTEVMERIADALAEAGDLYIHEDGPVSVREGDEIVEIENLERYSTWQWEEAQDDTPASTTTTMQHEAASAGGVEAEGVDRVEGPGAGSRARVVPGWLLDRRVLFPWVGGRVLDGVALGGFHVVRCPWYVLRGLGVVVQGAVRWVVRPDDDEQHKSDLARAGSVQARSSLRYARGRGRVVRMVACLVPVGGVWVWAELGDWGLFPAVVVAGSVAGLIAAGWGAVRGGRDARQAAVVRRRVPALSRPFVSEALAIVDCGSVKLPSGGVARPVIVSSSPIRGGEVMVVDLPPGMSVSRLLRRHEDFAQALGRPAECVVVEPLPRVSPGRFELFVASKRLDEKGAPAWAGVDGKARSFFDGVPVGVDARGRDVVVPLFEANGMIAGATGMGKSYTARLLLMGAALDPTVTLLVHNMKGGPDYRAFAPVAHTLRSGSSAADLQSLVDDLMWMQSEIGRRGRVLEGLPASQAPEGKLTPELAKREGMGPVVMLVDEAQRAFASPMGKQIAALFEDVVRTCRAVGMSVHVVTQGTKEGAIPSGILDQLPHRIGHGVTTISDANLILGSDAHSRNYRAVDIDTAGIAYVGTAGGTMVKAALCKVDLPEVEKVVSKVHKLRASAGLLSGMAAGEVDADEHDGGKGSFLADVLSVWPTKDGKPRRNALSSELAGYLLECDPDEYGQCDGSQISRRMADAGVEVSSQRTPQGPGRGVKHADVVQAARQHDGP